MQPQSIRAIMLVSCVSGYTKIPARIIGRAVPVSSAVPFNLYCTVLKGSKQSPQNLTTSACVCACFRVGRGVRAGRGFLWSAIEDPTEDKAKQVGS